MFKITVIWDNYNTQPSLMIKILRLISFLLINDLVCLPWPFHVRCALLVFCVPDKSGDFCWVGWQKLVRTQYAILSHLSPHFQLKLSFAFLLQYLFLLILQRFECRAWVKIDNKSSLLSIIYAKPWVKSQRKAFN